MFRTDAIPIVFLGFALAMVEQVTYTHFEGICGVET